MTQPIAKWTWLNVEPSGGHVDYITPDQSKSFYIYILLNLD